MAQRIDDSASLAADSQAGHPPARSSVGSLRLWLAITALALVLTGLGIARWEAIAGLYPYARHVDEIYFTQVVGRMKSEGDLNPHFFRYPSLPLYLALTTSYVDGLLFGNADSGRISLSKVGSPFAPPGLFWTARNLWGVLSIAALAFLSLAVWSSFGRTEAILVPIVVSLSATYQVLAVQYVNVDMVMMFFVSAALFVALWRWEDSSDLWKAWLPGILCGLAVASKYNSGLVLVPCALAILFAAPGHRLRQWAILGLASAVAFFVAVPFSVLDFNAFIADVLWEMDHYRSGEGLYSGDTGLPQFLFYLTAIREEYGVPLTLMTLVGIGHAFRIDWRRALTLSSMPVLMLIYMSTNRVHYLRTVVAVIALAGVFQAIGIGGVLRSAWAAVLAAKEAHSHSRGVWFAVLQASAWIVAIFVLGAAIENTAARDRLLDHNIEEDTRHRAIAWLEENVEEGDGVLIAADIYMDPMASDRLGAVQVSHGLGNVDELMESCVGRTCYVVMTRYTKNVYWRLQGPDQSAIHDRRLSQARARIRSVAWHPGSRVALRLPGKELLLSPIDEAGTEVQNSPFILIYQIEASSMDAG